MRALPNNGWLHDGVPVGARLVTVDGSVEVPVAGGSAYVDGAAPYGGAGYLYRPDRVQGSATRRARLLAVAVGLHDAQTIFHVSQTAGADFLLATLLGLPTDRAIPFRQLQVGVASVLNTDLVTLHRTAGAAAAPSLFAYGGGPFSMLLDGVIPAEVTTPWYVTVAGAADGIVTCTIKPEAARLDVTAELELARIIYGAALAFGSPSAVRGRVHYDDHPEVIEGAGFASWQTLAGGRDPLDVDDATAVRLKVSNAAASLVGAGARVAVRVQIAEWED